jgi:hypothetical protein
VALCEPVLRLYLLEAPLPALARLRKLLPDLEVTTLGFVIPLRDRSPEEVLAACLKLGVIARATRIAERPIPP